jgi:hypothetical protein
MVYWGCSPTPLTTTTPCVAPIRGRPDSLTRPTQRAAPRRFLFVMDPESELLTESEFEERLMLQAAHVTPREVRELVARLPRLRRSFQDIHNANWPHLAGQLEILGDAVEAFVSGVNEEIPLIAVAEAVVSIRHLWHSLEAGPEMLAQLDFTQEATLAGLVLERYRSSFERFAMIKWGRIGAAGENK